MQTNINNNTRGDSPKLLLPEVNSPKETSNSGWGVTQQPPQSTARSKTVFLNENFDFVLPGPVEGTLIDLVDEEVTNAVTGGSTRSPVQGRTNPDTVGHLIDTAPDSEELVTASQEVQSIYSSEALAAISDEEDTLCIYSAGSDTQRLLGEEETHHHHHLDEMDREAEPLIAFNRGRLGSNDVTLTISVPGESIVLCFCRRVGDFDCNKVKTNCQY